MSLFRKQQPQQLFDLSHPMVRHAQHRADHNGRPFILALNVLGGVDVIDGAHPDIDENAILAMVSPSPKSKKGANNE